MAAEADELFTLRNLFYLSNFQVRRLVGGGRRGCLGDKRVGERKGWGERTTVAAPPSTRVRTPIATLQEAIAEAGTLAKLKTETLKLERDAYVYRSQIGLGQHRCVVLPPFAACLFWIIARPRSSPHSRACPHTRAPCSRVISTVRHDAPLALQAVKQLAVYLSAPSGVEGQAQRAGALARADALVGTLAEGDAAGAAIVQSMAASMHIHEEQYEAALRCARSAGSLELMAVGVQVMLRMDRPDLADKQVKLMQERDDEACLTQLSAAAVCLALGGVRVKEAGLLYKDAIDRYGETVPVLNGGGVAATSTRAYPEAGRLLLDALAKDPDHPDTLANMVSLLQHTGKGGEAGQYMDRLRRVAPGHPFVVGYARVEAAFDRVAATFA